MFVWPSGYAIAMKIALNILSWFETISEDEVSTLKRLEMLFETKRFKSFLNDFS